MAKKKPARAQAAKKAKKAAAKKSTRKTATRGASKNVARKAAKKAAKKVVARKAASKVAKKVAAKRTAAKKAKTAKKVVARKVAARKIVAKKTAAKKPAVKTSPAKTAPVKKVAAKPVVVKKVTAQAPTPVAVARKAVAAKPAPAPAAAPRPKRAPTLDRSRKTVDLEPHGVPSSLDLDRTPSAARSGGKELSDRIKQHTSTGPAITAGDVDANWEDAETVGDEAPGGDNPTPDQDVVDEIGRALGVEYDDDEELKGGDEIASRDRHRWELDPASSDDFKDRD